MQYLHVNTWGVLWAHYTYVCMTEEMSVWKKIPLFSCVNRIIETINTDVKKRTFIYVCYYFWTVSRCAHEPLTDSSDRFQGLLRPGVSVTIIIIIVVIITFIQMGVSLKKNKSRFVFLPAGAEAHWSHLQAHTGCLTHWTLSCATERHTNTWRKTARDERCAEHRATFILEFWI